MVEELGMDLLRNFRSEFFFFAIAQSLAYHFGNPMGKSFNISYDKLTLIGN